MGNHNVTTMPCLLDPHVHFRDWAQSGKETIRHGFESALNSGVTEIFDMPNTVPPLTEADAIYARLEDARRAIASFPREVASRLSYHLYAGITPDHTRIHRLVALQKELFPHVVGLKFFVGHSTGNMGVIDDTQQKEVYRTLAEAGYQGVVALHCEKESLLKPALDRPGDAVAHSLSRPSGAEVQSVRDQIAFSREAGFQGTLHVCHLSTPEALKEIQTARRQGIRITCAVTPHHALLSTADVTAERRLCMNPPLRTEGERASLYDALVEGAIDWVETDHAPHTCEDKAQGANGIPGYTGLLLLLSRLRSSGVSEMRLQELFGGSVLKTFGLEERAVVLPDSTFIENHLPVSRTQYPWDPYAGISL